MSRGIITQIHNDVNIERAAQNWGIFPQRHNIHIYIIIPTGWMYSYWLISMFMQVFTNKYNTII